MFRTSVQTSGALGAWVQPLVLSMPGSRQRLPTLSNFIQRLSTRGLWNPARRARVSRRGVPGRRSTHRRVPTNRSPGQAGRFVSREPGPTCAKGGPGISRLVLVVPTSTYPGFSIISPGAILLAPNDLIALPFSKVAIALVFLIGFRCRFKDS